MSNTKTCPACEGYGYVADGDADKEKAIYRDCEVCDTQGKIPKEEATDDFVQGMPSGNCF